MIFWHPISRLHPLICDSRGSTLGWSTDHELFPEPTTALCTQRALGNTWRMTSRGVNGCVTQSRCVRPSIAVTSGARGERQRSWAGRAAGPREAPSHTFPRSLQPWARGPAVPLPPLREAPVLVTSRRVTAETFSFPVSALHTSGASGTSGQDVLTSPPAPGSPALQGGWTASY